VLRLSIETTLPTTDQFSVAVDILMVRIQKPQNGWSSMTANLTFIPLGTVGPRHPQVRVCAC
jgi:hypothetical protein